VQLGAIVENTHTQKPFCKGFSQCDGSRENSSGPLGFYFNLFISSFFFFPFLETAVADVLFIQREIRLRGLEYSSNKLPNSVN